MRHIYVKGRQIPNLGFEDEIARNIISKDEIAARIHDMEISNGKSTIMVNNKNVEVLTS